MKIQKSNPRLAAVLKNQMVKAEKSLKDAEALNASAGEAFNNIYVLPIIKKLSEDNATTTIEISFTTSSAELGFATKKSTSSEPEALPTKGKIEKDSGDDENLDVSIKDLIKSSFQKVREAYQIFIEMSNSVRELP